ncbi:HAD-IIA family hydrolase [Halarsenatibacter silvermanii]|uniref:Acid sugar phosphatase n=1 Tax=Halarsenatibacter silvermanii TaxID=321763 RepID=A0A1G9HD84_9FIRM|nr:HAD-IIA family hydrolase [Halarsenatibacter silvermanii]SDL10786.1 NagD protein [Halarsenatibacter silvermanii]
MLADYEGFIFDLDGTIYLGEELIPGAREVIEKIKNLNKGCVFLSNKPIARRENYAEKLIRLGIETSPEGVINSSLVTADFLAKNLPGAAVYVLGENSLIAELEEAGLEVVNKEGEAEGHKVVEGDFTGKGYDFFRLNHENKDYEDIDCLVVSFDRTLHYGRLNDALQILQKGAKFIATNPDTTCPLKCGEVPDAGSIIAAVEAASGRRVEKIMGKPSAQMIETALSAMNSGRENPISREDCLMVGDRIGTDIKMGKKAGLTTAAVLSGVSDRQEIEKSEIKPDLVLDSVREML